MVRAAGSWSRRTDDNFNTAVDLLLFDASGRRSRKAGLAEAARFNGIRWNTHRGNQPFLHGPSAEFTQAEIVVIRSEGITVALDEKTRAGIAEEKLAELLHT